MKKLLVLMLVVGMASLASATPTITASATTLLVGGTVDIYVSGTAAEATDYPTTGGGSFYLWLDYASNGFAQDATLSLARTGTIGEAAGGAATIYSAWYANYGLILGADPVFVDGTYPESTDVDAGLWFTLTVTGSQIGETSVDLYDGSLGALLGSVDIAVVPEPMTIALLGLGGLFLRRRK